MALMVVLAGSECRGASRGATTAMPAPVATSRDDAGIAKARADSLRYPYTAADVRFMQSMIGHHTQAITMAGWAPSHGANSSVRTLAERIINAQQDEIVTMRQWLQDRRQKVPGPGASMTMMMDGKAQEMLMPGMLTQAQMQQLDQARGPDFDHLFLTFMIQHHRGAVSMVQDLFDTYGASQDETIFKFASDVNVDQSTEIARMEKMLASMALGKSIP